MARAGSNHIPWPEADFSAWANHYFEAVKKWCDDNGFDPILPSSTQNAVITFSQVPSGRWFDPNPAAPYRLDMVSGDDSFARVVDFPTGHGDFEVFVGGSPIGHFASGQAAELPAGVCSFVVQGICPVFIRVTLGRSPFSLHSIATA